MLSHPISCNFLSAVAATPIPTPTPSCRLLCNFYNKSGRFSIIHENPNLKVANLLKVSPLNLSLKLGLTRSRSCCVRHRCHNSLNNESNNLNDQQQPRDWTTSILLFLLWAALMYYVLQLTPNQTPSRDMYFLEKLLNLKGEDGFEMNQVLVSLWYIMGLWPLAYSMLLLPCGRSSKGGVPVWPFLVLSCFGGAYVLLPYFVLWKPPAPCVEEAELGRWPLNILESKLTAGVVLGAGLGIIGYAAFGDASVWREFYQYFRESKFIHVTCVDFCLLSAFAPFWVYNDMSARKWLSEKGSSSKQLLLLALTLIPFLGPALYLVLRPPLAAITSRD